MMEATSGNWSHDWLGAFLLLFLRERDSYGRALREEMVDLGFEAMRPEEIYRTLHLMEEAGLIFSEKEESGFMLSQWRYGLTKPGRAYLDFLAHSLEECRGEITLFFRAYDRHPLPEVYG